MKELLVFYNYYSSSGIKNLFFSKRGICGTSLFILAIRTSYVNPVLRILIHFGRQMDILLYLCIHMFYLFRSALIVIYESVVWKFFF